MIAKQLITASILLLFFNCQAFSQNLKDSTILSFQTLVHFDSDKYKINKTNQAPLVEFIKKCNELEEYNIIVNAHTDDIASHKYNLLLSEKRTDHITKYLTKNGIPALNIKSNFYGESVPLVEGQNESNRKLNRRGLVLLYKKHRFLPIYGTITDGGNNTIAGAKILLKTKILSTNALSDRQGKFTILAPLGQKLNISTVAKGYFFNSIKIEKLNIKKPLYLNIALSKTKIGRKFIIENMLFLGNHSNLLPKSFDELDHLKRTMDINKDLCIEIAGHINKPNKKPVPRGAWDFELSVARAITIYDSLKNNGVKAQRMIAKGYANWEMLFPKAVSEYKQAKNRRVEIRIKDCNAIENIKNDTITENFVKAKFDPFKLKFSKEKFNVNIILFSKEDKTNIIQSLKYLKKNNIDPSRYTYQQLLNKDWAKIKRE